MKRRKPTPEEAERIHAIVLRVSKTIVWETESFSWGTHAEMREAYDLMDALGTYRPNKACFPCYVKGLSELAQTIGLPPIDRGIPQERAEMRMAICRACPAFHATTESCGRLVIDALFPKTVMVDGREVQPCGCYLPIKTEMKHTTCPANKW